MYKEFWRLFVKEYHGSKRALIICLMTAMVSLLEGINVGLLLPLLETLEVTNTDSHWLSGAMEMLYADFGIQLSLGSILLSLGAIVLIIGLFKYSRMVLIAKTSTDFVSWLRQRTMKSLLSANMSYYHKQKTGELASVLTTQANVASSIVDNITELIANVGLIIANLNAALLISPALKLVSLAVLSIGYLSVPFQIVKAKLYGKHLADSQNELETGALVNLNVIRLIKAFSLEKIRSSIFTQKATNTATAQFDLLKNRAALLVMQETIIFGLIAGLVYIGISVIGASLSIIIAVLFILYRVSPRVTGLNSSRQAISANMAGIHNVVQVIDESANARESTGTKHIDKINTKIDLVNISFSYNDADRVLTNASLSLEKGQVTAIVGDTGSGKSTILDLILKHYSPSSGTILVDNIDLEEIELQSWRSLIGVVSQDIFLFNDSIAGNIVISNSQQSNELVLEAIDTTQATSFVHQLPDGYDTYVGERGWNLSGGQRQKIALARAIVKSPQLLILDEPTSALDAESEQIVQEYITSIKQSSTIIIVSHRMSTIRRADKIAVLQNGSFVEIGDWDTLMLSKGVFYNLNVLQSEISNAQSPSQEK